jgi:hypothetical protein
VARFPSHGLDASSALRNGKFRLRETGFQVTRSRLRGPAPRSRVPRRNFRAAAASKRERHRTIPHRAKSS